MRKEGMRKEGRKTEKLRKDFKIFELDGMKISFNKIVKC